MGLSAFTTILLFLVCLAGGIAIGFLLAYYLKSGADEPQGEKFDIPSVERKAAFTKPQEPALLQVGRNKKKFWVEMDGQRWENPDDLSTENRKELTNIVQELGAWVEVAPDFLPQPPAYDPKPAKNSLFSRSYSSGKQTGKEALSPARLDLPGNQDSMVSQIDTILQQKLVGTPFANLEIHLIEGPGGEVNVQVGAIKHTAIESIPNRDIQELIHLSVAEWEKITQ